MDNALEAHLHSQTDDATRFFWHRLRWRFVAEHLPRHSFTLLDVGAGSGVIGDFLTRDRPDATYVFDEPITSLRARLSDRYGRNADCHSVDPLPHVDVVTLLDVLEHIEDDREFLDRLVARLKPATTIVVTVPASMRLWSRWDVALGHVRRYERDDLASLLNRDDCEVVETGRLFPEMLPAAWWRAHRDPAPRPDTNRTEPLTKPTGAAEFPVLPPKVNWILEQVGRVGVRWRTSMPAGTSLCAVLRVL